MVFSCLCCCHSSQKSLFVCTNRINLLNLKESSDRLVSNCCKRIIKLPNLPILIKKKSPSLLRNLVLRTFGESLIVFLKKINLLYFVFSTAQRCYLLHLIKQNCFSKNSNIDDSGISLPIFPSRTNPKLHNISLTFKMVKKVIMNLDSLKASGPDCIPVVSLKNWRA